MDKYQQSLLNRVTFFLQSSKGDEKVELGEELVLHQNEDYNIGGYLLVLSSPIIESVTYQDRSFLSKDDQVIVDIDFNNIGKSLTISFRNGLADDCSLPISAVLSDKNAFDKKVAAQNQEQLLASLALRVATGNNLINVFWKKATPNVNKCMLKILFRGEGGIDYLVNEGEVKGEFFSLNGLAFGSYLVSIEQFAEKELIVSSSVGITIKDKLDSLKQEMKDGLDKVSGAARGAGRHTVTIG